MIDLGCDKTPTCIGITEQISIGILNAEMKHLCTIYSYSSS